jgi:hypothetical protein
MAKRLMTFTIEDEDYREMRRIKRTRKLTFSKIIRAGIKQIIRQNENENVKRCDDVVDRHNPVRAAKSGGRN